MKNIKILLIAIILIATSIVTIQSCTADRSDVTESSEATLEIEKSNQINQESQFENLSTITKEDYLSMSPERKTDFYEAYINSFRSGGGCTCNGCCSIECPSATKPNCQCGTGECSCQCEPYGSGGIAIRFAIKKNKDGSVILTEKELSKKSLNSFTISNLPNTKEIVDLFNNEPIFKRKNDRILKLTAKDYYILESKFQAQMENYTIEQYFEVEYGF